jgi:hypothetical protein
MATPVGGTTFALAAPNTFNVYSPTAGNTLIFFLLFDAPVSGVTVTNYAGTAYSDPVAGPVIGNLYSFIAPVKQAYPYWPINWTGSANCGVAVEEYSGITGVSLTNHTTASGNSGTATASLITDDASGDTIVAGMGNVSNNPLTATVGTQRQQNSGNVCRLALIDNTNGSASSLACTATMTSSPWDVILLELRFAIGAVPFIAVVQSDRPNAGGIAVGGEATDQALGNYSHTVCFPYGQTFPRG